MMERIPDEWIVQVRLFKFKTGGGLSFAEAMVNPKLINDIGLITRQWPGRVDFLKDPNHE
jgi:hypothetical protein